MVDGCRMTKRILGSVVTRGGRHDRMDYPDFQHRLGHISQGDAVEPGVRDHSQGRLKVNVALRPADLLPRCSGFPPGRARGRFAVSSSSSSRDSVGVRLVADQFVPRLARVRARMAALLHLRVRRRSRRLPRQAVNLHAGDIVVMSVGLQTPPENVTSRCPLTTRCCAGASTPARCPGAHPRRQSSVAVHARSVSGPSVCGAIGCLAFEGWMGAAQRHPARSARLV